MKIKNVSPYGDLDVPLLRTVLEAGAELDVTEEQARVLLHQRENFVPADPEAQAIADELDAADVLEQPPAATAKKPAWVAWATKQGDPDPDSKTQKQLIELYGAEDGS